MDALIVRLRGIINDPAGLLQTFSDAELLQLLALHREDVERSPLSAATGTIFTAPHGDWDSAVSFTDAAGLPLIPDMADAIAGRWTFNNRPLAVYLSGASYDMHAVAAEALEQWATKLALQVDFSADGASYKLAQQREGLLAMASRERAKSRAAGGGAISYLVRTDIW